MAFYVFDWVLVAKGTYQGDVGQIQRFFASGANVILKGPKHFGQQIIPAEDLQKIDNTEAIKIFYS